MPDQPVYNEQQNQQAYQDYLRRLKTTSRQQQLSSETLAALDELSKLRNPNTTETKSQIHEDPNEARMKKVQQKIAPVQTWGSIIGTPLIAKDSFAPMLGGTEFSKNAREYLFNRKVNLLQKNANLSKSDALRHVGKLDSNQTSGMSNAELTRLAKSGFFSRTGPAMSSDEAIDFAKRSALSSAKTHESRVDAQYKYLGIKPGKLHLNDTQLNSAFENKAVSDFRNDQMGFRSKLGRVLYGNSDERQSTLRNLPINLSNDTKVGRALGHVGETANMGFSALPALSVGLGSAKQFQQLSNLRRDREYTGKSGKVAETGLTMANLIRAGVFGPAATLMAAPALTGAAKMAGMSPGVADVINSGAHGLYRYSKDSAMGLTSMLGGGVLKGVSGVANTLGIGGGNVDLASSLAGAAKGTGLAAGLAGATPALLGGLTMALPGIVGGVAGHMADRKRRLTRGFKQSTDKLVKQFSRSTGIDSILRNLFSTNDITSDRMIELQLMMYIEQNTSAIPKMASDMGLMSDRQEKDSKETLKQYQSNLDTPGKHTLTQKLGHSWSKGLINVQEFAHAINIPGQIADLLINRKTPWARKQEFKQAREEADFKYTEPEKFRKIATSIGTSYSHAKLILTPATMLIKSSGAESAESQQVALQAGIYDLLRGQFNIKHHQIASKSGINIVKSPYPNEDKNLLQRILHSIPGISSMVSAFELGNKLYGKGKRLISGGKEAFSGLRDDLKTIKDGGTGTKSGIGKFISKHVFGQEQIDQFEKSDEIKRKLGFKSNTEKIETFQLKLPDLWAELLHLNRMTVESLENIFNVGNRMLQMVGHEGVNFSTAGSEQLVFDYNTGKYVTAREYNKLTKDRRSKYVDEIKDVKPSFTTKLFRKIFGGEHADSEFKKSMKNFFNSDDDFKYRSSSSRSLFNRGDDNRLIDDTPSQRSATDELNENEQRQQQQQQTESRKNLKDRLKDIINLLKNGLGSSTKSGETPEKNGGIFGKLFGLLGSVGGSILSFIKMAAPVLASVAGVAALVGYNKFSKGGSLGGSVIDTVQDLGMLKTGITNAPKLITGVGSKLAGGASKLSTAASEGGILSKFLGKSQGIVSSGATKVGNVINSGTDKFAKYFPKVASGAGNILTKIPLIGSAMGGIGKVAGVASKVAPGLTAVDAAFQLGQDVKDSSRFDKRYDKFKDEMSNSGFLGKTWALTKKVINPYEGGAIVGTSINHGINKAVSAITGEKNATLGGAIYDLFHGKPNQVSKKSDKELNQFKSGPEWATEITLTYELTKKEIESSNSSGKPISQEISDKMDAIYDSVKSNLSDRAYQKYGIQIGDIKSLAETGDLLFNKNTKKWHTKEEVEEEIRKEVRKVSNPGYFSSMIDRLFNKNQPTEDPGEGFVWKRVDHTFGSTWEKIPKEDYDKLGNNAGIGKGKELTSDNVNKNVSAGGGFLGKLGSLFGGGDSGEAAMGEAAGANVETKAYSTSEDNSKYLSAGGAKPLSQSQQTNAAKYDELINKYASQYGVDPNLVRGIVKQESGFDPNATSPVGAKGLMQLMPGTAKDLGVADRTDPEQNIRGGTKYIAQLLKRFNGDVAKALAAYNWGMGNVEKKGLGNMPKETQDYLKKVTSNKAMFDETKGASTQTASTSSTPPKAETASTSSTPPKAETTSTQTASTSGFGMPASEMKSRFTPASSSSPIIEEKSTGIPGVEPAPSSVINDKVALMQTENDNKTERMVVTNQPTYSNRKVTPEMMREANATSIQIRPDEEIPTIQEKRRQESQVKVPIHSSAPSAINTGMTASKSQEVKDRAINPELEGFIQGLFANTVTAFQQSVKNFALGQTPFQILR